MKKLTMLFLAFTFSLGVIAQNLGMGNGHENLNNNSSYSITEILLGAILIVVVIALVMRSFNSSRIGK